MSTGNPDLGNQGKRSSARDLLAKTIAKEREFRARNFLAPYTGVTNFYKF